MDLKQLTTYCPVCGEEVIASIYVKNVHVFSTTTLQVEVSVSSISHTCKEKPNSDGMEPIHRFLKTGNLDDMGRCYCPDQAYRYSGNEHIPTCPWYDLPEHRTP